MDGARLSTPSRASRLGTGRGSWWWRVAAGGSQSPESAPSRQRRLGARPSWARRESGPCEDDSRPRLFSERTRLPARARRDQRFAVVSAGRVVPQKLEGDVAPPSTRDERVWQGASQARKRLAKSVERADPPVAKPATERRLEKSPFPMKDARVWGKRERSRVRAEANLGDRECGARAKATALRFRERQVRQRLGRRSCCRKKTPTVRFLDSPKQVGGRETSDWLVSTSRKRRSDTSGRPERGCSSLKSVGCRRRSEMPWAAHLTAKAGRRGLV